MTFTDTVPTVRLPRPTRRATLAFGCLAMLTSYLPFSAVNGTLGTIAAATGAGPSDQQWFSDSFAVALAAGVLFAGVLGDLFGRRRISVLGLLLTAGGSALALVAGSLPSATTVPTLFLAQAVSGLGAAGVMSATLGLVSAAAPDAAARQRHIAAWAAAVVVGLGGGPFLAGAVISVAPWPWMFAPIFAAALAVAAFGRARSQEHAAPEGRALDLAGLLTSALGVVGLVGGAIRVAGSGPDPVSVTALVLGVGALAAFALVESRVASPSLRPELFRSRGFTAAGAAAAAVLFSVVGSVIVLSLTYAEQGLTDLAIAERLGCLFLANAAASLAAARVQRRWGAPRTLVAGLVVAALGALLLTTVTGPGLAAYAGPLLVLGAGGGLVMATSSAVAVQSVAAPLAGMAGAGNNALRQLGAALGPAVVGGLLVAQVRSGTAYPGAAHLCFAALAALLLLAALLSASLLARRRPTTTD